MTDIRKKSILLETISVEKFSLYLYYHFDKNLIMNHNEITRYIAELSRIYKVGNAAEHTYRPALKSMSLQPDCSDKTVGLLRLKTIGLFCLNSRAILFKQSGYNV